MKKKVFITLFLSFHIMLILLQIKKQSTMMHLSYEKQQKEKKLALLTTHIADLTTQLHEQKNKQTVKLFAQKKGMQQLPLKKVKRIPSHAITT